MPDRDSTTPSLRLIHEALGIPGDYPDTCGMAPVAECTDLVAVEKDIFGRQPYMDANAHRAWLAMQAAAAKDGVILQLVSAFRSIAYQQKLLAKKLAAGQRIEDILRVNAAPGYSEHHSGCALDLTTPGVPPLEEDFENTPAYTWLSEHAAEYGFRLSFPRDNAAGITYEPWHWRYWG